jgi:hypothetical protein
VRTEILVELRRAFGCHLDSLAVSERNVVTGLAGILRNQPCAHQIAEDDATEADREDGLEAGGYRDQCE